MKRKKIKELNLYQTLKIVEDFMLKSGVRDYCENVCGGKCCENNCFNSKNACYKNEGRRLPCSVYICSEMRQPNDYHYSYFHKASRLICCEYDKRHLARKRRLNNHYHAENIFFEPLKNNTKNNFCLKGEDLSLIKLGFSDGALKTFKRIIEVQKSK